MHELISTKNCLGWEITGMIIFLNILRKMTFQRSPIKSIFTNCQTFYGTISVLLLGGYKVHTMTILFVY